MRSSRGWRAGSALTSTFQRSREGFEELLEEGTGSLPATRAWRTSSQGRSAIRPAPSVTRSRVASWKATSLPSDVACTSVLDVAVARFHRAAELGDGVLQTVRRAAPVGEGDRAGVVEVRVAYARAHPGSIARSG